MNIIAPHTGTQGICAVARCFHVQQSKGTGQAPYRSKQVHMGQRKYMHSVRIHLLLRLLFQLALALFGRGRAHSTQRSRVALRAFGALLSALLRLVQRHVHQQRIEVALPTGALQESGDVVRATTSTQTTASFRAKSKTNAHIITYRTNQTNPYLPSSTALMSSSAVRRLASGEYFKADSSAGHTPS
jgi:hypothetical protein